MTFLKDEIRRNVSLVSVTCGAETRDERQGPRLTDQLQRGSNGAGQ